MSLVRQLTSASLISVCCGALLAASMHFVYPDLRENDATEEDHATTMLLTITDAPHIFITIVAAFLKSAALDKIRKNVGSAGGGGDAATGGGGGIFSSYLFQTILVGFLSVTAGLSLHFLGIDHLYAPLTYLVVLHSIAQIVWTIQQSSVDEHSVFSAIPHTSHIHSGGSGNAGSSAKTGLFAALNAQHHWWAPALLRPRGFDAWLTALMLLCPVAVWFMDVERGLDWFHWELEHRIDVPRAALPLVSLLFVLGLLVQIVRFCSVSSMELPLHLMPPSLVGSSSTASAAAHRELHFQPDEPPATISPGFHNHATGPLAGFASSISTPVLGLLAGAAACVAFAIGIVVPDRDISVPLLAVPHTGLSIVACLCIVHRCSRILFPARSPTTVVAVVLGMSVVWGIVDHLIVDEFVDEPHKHVSFLAYAVPQILHLALDPSRTAWFLHSDERFMVSLTD